MWRRRSGGRSLKTNRNCCLSCFCVGKQAEHTNGIGSAPYSCAGWPREPKRLSSPRLQPRNEVKPIRRLPATRVNGTRPSISGNSSVTFGAHGALTGDSCRGEADGQHARVPVEVWYQGISAHGADRRQQSEQRQRHERLGRHQPGCNTINNQKPSGIQTVYLKELEESQNVALSEGNYFAGKCFGTAPSTKH